MIRFFDVTLQFRAAGQLVRPTIKHIPAADEAEAGRKALDTATAKVARSYGEEVAIHATKESEG